MLWIDSIYRDDGGTSPICSDVVLSGVGLEVIEDMVRDFLK